RGGPAGRARDGRRAALLPAFAQGALQGLAPEPLGRELIGEVLHLAGQALHLLGVIGPEGGLLLGALLPPQEIGGESAPHQAEDAPQPDARGGPLAPPPTVRSTRG